MFSLHACREINASKLHEKKLLIIQSEYSERKSDLIACARHRLMDEKEGLTMGANGITHIVFIVQLPRISGGTSFTSFQGGSWISTHIDELTCPSGAKHIVLSALSKPIYEFFHMLIEKNMEVPDDFKVCKIIKDSIQVAVSKIVSNDSYDQMESAIKILFEVISNDFCEGQYISLQ